MQHSRREFEIRINGIQQELTTRRRRRRSLAVVRPPMLTPLGNQKSSSVTHRSRISTGADRPKRSSSFSLRLSDGLVMKNALLAIWSRVAAIRKFNRGERDRGEFRNRLSPQSEN